MKSSIIQSLIKRVSGHIEDVENSLVELKGLIKYLEERSHIRQESDRRFYKQYEKLRSQRKALVKIQCELKGELADKVCWGRYEKT